MMIIVVLLALLILGSLPFLSRDEGQPEQKEPEHRPDARFYARQSTTLSTPNWLAIYLAACESPAEEAFLRAMIPAYALGPSSGLLVGSDIRMNLQVEVKRYEKNGAWRLYRVDFLINDWLVVEIDGAAHHSSLEALKKDSLRDSFLRGKRFTTLHLPAKLVFNTPAEAIRRVQAALAEGPQPLEAPPAKPGKSSFFELMTDYSDQAKKSEEVDQILRWSAFHSARTMINGIIKLETLRLEQTDENGFLKQSERFDYAKMLLNDLTHTMATKDIDSNSASAQKFDPSVINRPTNSFAHPDPYIAAALNRIHRDLKAEIPYYFKIVQAKLRNSRELARRVEEQLAMLNCTTCIEAIRTNYDV
jgi:very-short-patch-repair endonuclease